MSRLKPIWGVDISDNNPAISLRELEEDNYDFCMLRVTGGYGGGNDVYMDRDYRERHKQLVRRNMVPGVYGFPIDPNVVDLDRQLDRYLNGVIGGFDGKLICIDYEKYEPAPQMSINPAGLKAYVRGIRKEIGPGHPIGMYAGREWWISAPHSGDLDDYDDNMWQWVPKYWQLDPVDHPKRHYFARLAVMRYWQKFAGEKRAPLMSQFGIGRAGGGPVDVNAFRGSRQKLLSLTRANTYHRPADGSRRR